jgi:hypothetical protein
MSLASALSVSKADTTSAARRTDHRNPSEKAKLAPRQLRQTLDLVRLLQASLR